MDAIINKIKTKAPSLDPFHTALAYAYHKSPLAQTAKDLIRKGYLDERFANQLKTDPKIQGQSLFNYGKEIFGIWQCPTCSISIKGPKEWMKHHIKTHFKPDSKKENEMQLAKVNPYEF